MADIAPNRAGVTPNRSGNAAVSGLTVEPQVNATRRADFARTVRSRAQAQVDAVLCIDRPNSA